MDGRIKSGHDGVVAVAEHEEPGADRLIAMPPLLVMPGLDPGIHGRCMESRARPAPIAMPLYCLPSICGAANRVFPSCFGFRPFRTGRTESGAPGWPAA